MKKSRKTKKNKEKLIKREKKNFDDVQKDELDKEQRRATRLGAIIAIVAIIGTLCTFMVKVTLGLINVWPQKGMLYWYLMALFLCALSTIIIILFDIIRYILCDLKRYDVLDSNCKLYDDVSDKSYSYISKEFKTYAIMISCAFFTLIPLEAVYVEKSQRERCIVVSTICLCIGIMMTVIWLKTSSKEERKKTFMTILNCLGKWFVCSIICYCILVIYIDNKQSIIEIDYGANGNISIYNSSANEYNGLEIQVYDRNSENIYTECVDKDNLLFAREEHYISAEVDGEKVLEGALIASEILHWTYIFDLKEIINESGKFAVNIIVYQDNETIELINYTIVESGEFTFAQRKLKKKY